jgi:formylglycine-generating enzyme required for sulfatase activity
MMRSKMLKMYFVLSLTAFFTCPINADIKTLNEDLKKLVKHDEVKKDETKKIDRDKLTSADLKQYLQTFNNGGETGFDCNSLCRGFDGDNLTKCLESCEKAKNKVKENRQQTKCSKPENMEHIPAGSFLRGFTGDYQSFEDLAYMDTKVIITNDFYIDKYEVTQSNFESVMGYNPAYYKGKKCGGQCPVESMTWKEANSYCSAVGKRLPTEAEWEYAAKGGTTTRHYWGDEIDVNYLWYKDDSGKRPKPVGQKLPNAYGLFDMEGNVFEYV